MSFDLDTYRSVSAKLETDDIDFSSFREQPLSPDALRCLRYMHDVEIHTVCYLRDILVTQAHKDPDITSFLTMWNYEEHWHGEAIAEVLDAHNESAGHRSDRHAPSAPAQAGRLAAIYLFQLGSFLTPI